ncbi:hypothetical protein F2Q70_00012224 [Brassica cretica]|uniref:Uncharacterized protein n=1 Tax=Brassica cretica TaxID=69181 RepID=A0A8S9LX64_BRACR|nr:hypothetical protein F2Q70_00012224 [Brassica cretica]
MKKGARTGVSPRGAIKRSSLTVDPTRSRHAIVPDIYGTSYSLSLQSFNRTRRTVSLEVGPTAPEQLVENKGERPESPLAPIIPCIISFSVIPSP